MGAGRIVHSGVMPAYRAVGIQPVAAVDPDPAAQEAIRELWGVEQVFDDYRSMLDAVEPDVIDINIRWDVGLSPLRVEIVTEAARRGIHVIIAKPVAETWQQCLDMVRQARAGGIKFGVDFNTRFAPAFYGCRALIHHGALGPMISASINYHSALGRQHTNAFDAVHDVCVHAVDVLQSWYGTAPEQIYGNWSRRVDGIGSVLSATMEFAGGAPSTSTSPPATAASSSSSRWASTPAPTASRTRSSPDRPACCGPRCATGPTSLGAPRWNCRCSTRCRPSPTSPPGPICCSASAPTGSPGPAAQVFSAA